MEGFRTFKKLKDDVTLKGAVLTELEWAPHVDPTYIRLTVKDGAVTLAGQVASVEERKAAVRAVERVPGVKAVANDLEVRSSGCAYRTDSEIAADIVYESTGLLRPCSAA